MIPLSILAIFLALIIIFGFKKQTSLKNLAKKLQKENQDLIIKTQTLEALKLRDEEEKIRLKEEYQAQLKALKSAQDENLKLLEERLKENYNTQNALILAQNKQNINEDSKKILDEIFKPIKEQVKGYSERLMQNEIKIEQQIKTLFSYSQSVGENADKLAQILKGDKKVRGNFGELQLKNVLEQSGLIEGEQYKLQESLKLDGMRYVPDAIIYLERNKSIIVDSKFSLPDSFDFEQIDENTCAQIAKNLKNRINELANKPYAELKDSYEFTLLFLPYQNILDLALNSDNRIYQYASDRKIYLTTPHTLFMALKTISITWLNIKRNENATRAFDEIGKFYDKFEGVIESFKNMENALERVNKTKDEMANRLLRGNGNLQTRFKQLEDLGVKTKKALEKS